MDKKIAELIKSNPDLGSYINELNTELLISDDEKNILKSELQISKNEKNKLKSQNKVLSEENKSFKLQIDSLQFTLSKLNREIFGTKSEKINKDIKRGKLNEAEEYQNLNAIEPSIEKVMKKRKPKILKAEKFQNLESREIVYDLHDKKCTKCDSDLVEIGTKTRQTIEVIKKVIKVMEKSITYKCTKCDSFHKKEFPKLPIPGSFASPSLIAQVIVDKTANALPLNRQSHDYDRYGLDLSRQTLSNWMVRSGFLLELIFNKAKDEMLSRNIIHADETTLQVLKESGRKAKQKSYMWTYVSSRYDNQIILYEYQETRAGINAKNFLDKFKGYLHVDGYAGYNSVTDVTSIHCMAHLRRKFYDLFLVLPKEKQLNSNTTTALGYCNKIYSLDKKSRNKSVEKRYKDKQEHIKPLMLEFEDWLNKKELTASDGSSYGRAIAYGVKYLPSIIKYTDDGRLELDNNRAERAIKPFVIGRKNWLFSNTPNGAESSAISYSIVQTCLLNKLNPYQYLAHVLDVLANKKVSEIDLDKIMPYSLEMIERFKIDKKHDL